MGALQERLETLEVQGDQDKQRIAELQDELVALEALISGQDTAVSATNDQIAQQGEDLEAVNTSLDRLDKEIDLLAQEFAENVDDLVLNAEANQEEISFLALEFNATGNPINALRRELELVKAMELVTRSQLNIGQQNLGLAETDIEQALFILLNLEPLVFEFQQEALLDIISRLDLALENFPDDMDQVEADLEVAWGLLLEGLPMEPPIDGDTGVLVGELTPTPADGEDATPSPDETPEPTPTTTP
jgi:chromosome segregation ATPase